MSKSYKVTLTQEISEQLIWDILITAVEGGSNYWTSGWDVHRDSDLNVLSVRNIQTPDGEICEDVYPINIADALSEMAHDELYSQTLWRIINGEYDAIDADVVFQFATLGELVYG